MFLTDPITIVLSVIICVCLISLLYGWNRITSPNFPPGPKPLPIIGNLHIINKRAPYKTFLELAKQYGPVYSIQIGARKMVILCGYETVKDALVNHAEEFSGRGTLPIFHDVNKENRVIFANGENWKVMRRFALTTLRDFGMGKRTLEDKINEECDFLAQKLEFFKGKPFENTMIINGAIANIIVSILLGHRFDYEDPKFLRLMSIINENIRVLASPSVMLYNTFPSLMHWLPGNHHKIHSNVAEFQRFIRETFTDYRDKLDINDQRNLIDVFLVKQKEEQPTGQYFHNENLVGLVGNLFVAGMETTSTTLRWGLLIMMKYPEIQKNVQNEIEKVIGSSVPQMEHRKKMPYTDAVIHEIQRFGSIVPTNLPHKTTRDISFKGYFLPKETVILPVLTSVLRDKDYFEKPDEFYPQHFLDSEGNFVRNDAFMPFSAGQRICAGENLARMELFLFFTRLLQKFTFRLPPGASDVDLTPTDGATRSPKRHQMCALPRS